jgi:hypothetical protein
MLVLCTFVGALLYAAFEKMEREEERRIVEIDLGHEFVDDQREVA